VKFENIENSYFLRSKMMDMKSHSAKALRADKRTAADEAQVSLAQERAALTVCQQHGRELGERRASAIAACKADAVIAIDAELLKANIATEIAASRVVTSVGHHAQALDELRQAEAAVVAIANEIRMAEVVAMAERCERARDEELRLCLALVTFIGSEINRPINQPLRVMPEIVVRVLSRVPVVDGLHQTVGELRGVFGGTDAWDRRLQELVADDPAPQAEAVAA
jgi:hypothetical protein